MRRGCRWRSWLTHLERPGGNYFPFGLPDPHMLGLKDPHMLGLPDPHMLGLKDPGLGWVRGQVFIS